MGGRLRSELTTLLRLHDIGTNLGEGREGSGDSPLGAISLCAYLSGALSSETTSEPRPRDWERSFRLRRRRTGRAVAGRGGTARGVAGNRRGGKIKDVVILGQGTEQRLKWRARTHTHLQITYDDDELPLNGSVSRVVGLGAVYSRCVARSAVSTPTHHELTDDRTTPPHRAAPSRAAHRQTKLWLGKK